MPASLAAGSVPFAMLSVACWGASDFLGGYASQRANSYLLTAIAHGSGLLLVLGLALAGHSPLPGQSSATWAFAAGACGGAGLALFYRALASGSMGMTAPVSAVLGAAIPAAVTIALEGWPSPLVLAGFALAGFGIWLISQPQAGVRPGGLGLAVGAGVGFALFYLLMRRANDSPALWAAAFSRAGAFAVVAVMVLAGRQWKERNRGSSLICVLAGSLDVMGTVFFVRSSQAGRLDTAVVLTSLYPAVTVLLARIFLHEHWTRWKTVGMLAALAAVPLIAMQ
jgi:drug/metabolite transporter (DMT)-like permease